MPVRHGTAYWPGAAGVVGCTYTVSHGVSPGVATLEVQEQDVRNIRSYGDLVITDGVGAVTLRRCRVADVSYNSSNGGRTLLLHIHDRRWMWRHGYTTGNWNVPDPFPDPDLFPPGEFVAFNSPFAPGTFRPAHLLMADCLRELREAAPLIDPAPAVPVPARWEEEPPAYALQQIAEALGMRVCFQPALDRVLVAPLGVGRTLPADIPVVADHPSLSLPQRPASITLVGGAVLYNDYLRLEPVGFERNGQVKHIDQLSYRPAAGWRHTNPLTMGEVRATNQLTRQEAINLAKQCVYRTFRVEMADASTGLGPGPTVPRFGLVRDRKQIVLHPVRYGYYKDERGQQLTDPPFVVGSIYMAREDGVLLGGANVLEGNSDPTSIEHLPRTPRIDTARGIVTFDRQCFRYSNIAGQGHWDPPLLWLYTSFHLRAIVGQVLSKFVAGGTVPGLVDLGCPPEVLRHPELVPVVSVLRNRTNKAVDVVFDNLDEILPAAEYYLRAANDKYEIGAATDRTYNGVVPINPDGAIQQVSWSVGGGAPATTRASLNCEHARYLPSYPERRRTAQLFAFEGRDTAEKNAEAAPGPPGAHQGLPKPPGAIDFVPPGA